MGVLTITFKDGDGDIGLRQNEIDPPYDYNFFISLYEIKDGDSVEYIPVVYNPSTQTFDTLTFNQRIPMLTPAGPDKSISGKSKIHCISLVRIIHWIQFSLKSLSVTGRFTKAIQFTLH